MKNITSRLEEIRREGYSLDFSATFSSAFEIYKRMALMAGVAILLVSILVVAIGFGSIGLVLGASAFTESIADFKPTELPALYLFGYIVGGSLLSALMVPFTAGLIQMAYDAKHQGDVALGTAFMHYRSEYFGALFVAGLIVNVVTMGLTLGVEFLNSPLASLFATLITLIISLFLILYIPLIIFGRLPAVESLLTSISLVARSPLMIAVLVIVAALFSLVGLLALCIGILFTIPISYAMYFAIYDEIVGADPESEIDEIGRADF